MKTAFIFLAITLLANVLGFYFGWYLDYVWYNMALHFLGGFFVAMLMADYLNGHFQKENKLKNTLIILGATVFIGVIWEFAEYIGNQTLTEPIYKHFQTLV